MAVPGREGLSAACGRQAWTPGCASCAPSARSVCKRGCHGRAWRRGWGPQDQLLPLRWRAGKMGSRPASPLGPPPSHTAPCSPPPLPSRQRSRRLEATGSQDLLPTWSSVLGLPLQSPRLSWSVGLVFGGSFRTCLCGASGMSVPVTFLSWRNLRPPGCLAPVSPLFSCGCPSAALSWLRCPGPCSQVSVMFSSIFKISLNLGVVCWFGSVALICLVGVSFSDRS